MWIPPEIRSAILKQTVGSQDYSKTKIVVIPQKEKILKRKKGGGIFPPPLQFIGVSDRVWSGVKKI